MAIKKSIFDPSNDDATGTPPMTRFSGRSAQAKSKISDALIDGQTAEAANPDLAEPETPERHAPDEPVEQIKQALDEKERDEPHRDEA